MNVMSPTTRRAGASFGDPALRERALVGADLRNGKITAAEAREVYGHAV